MGAEKASVTPPGQARTWQRAGGQPSSPSNCSTRPRQERESASTATSGHATSSTAAGPGVARLGPVRRRESRTSTAPGATRSAGSKSTSAGGSLRKARGPARRERRGAGPTGGRERAANPPGH